MGVWRSLTGRRWWRWQTSAAVSGLMLAGAVLTGAISAFLDEQNEHANDRALRTALDRAQFEQECRFDLSIPVSTAQAVKLDALALGLVAAVRDDEAALAVQVERIEQASADEQAAIAVRADAVDTCNRRARQIYDR